ncbi:MAG TPA: hypothetical protein PKA88_08895 [Polyangiaceae bacterium]|nr:hypothetical protein [Polyangiaceae bacterium]
MAPLTRRGFCRLLPQCAALALLAQRALAAAPVIAAGREKEVMALFAPFALGAAVTPEMKLWNVRVAPEHITVELTGAATATLRLEHPERSQSSERSKSFAFQRDAAAASGAGKIAADALVASVRGNDAGDFWDDAPEPAPMTEAPQAASQQGFEAMWLPAVVTVVAGAGALWLARRSADSGA